MEKFLFNLSEPLLYTKDGDKLGAYQLEIDPPTMKSFKDVSILSQIVAKAFVDARKNVSEADMKEAEKDIKTDKTMDSNVIMIALMSSGCDLNELAEVFKSYCYTNCTIEDTNIKIKKLHFETMLLADFFKMMFDFIANFIVPFAFPVS